MLLPVGSTSRRLHDQNEQVALSREIFSLLRENVFEWSTSSSDSETTHTRQPAACRRTIKLLPLRLPRTARTLLSPEPAPYCGAAMCSPTPRARVPWPGKPSEPSDENNTVRLVRVRGDGHTCDRQKARPRTARVSANEANEADEVTAQHLAAAVLPDLDSQNGQMEMVQAEA